MVHPHCDCGHYHHHRPPAHHQAWEERFRERRMVQSGEHKHRAGHPAVTSLSCGTTKGRTLRLWHGVAVQGMAGRQPPDPFGRLLSPHQLHQGMAPLEVLGCVCLLSAVVFGTLGTWRGTGGLVRCHAGWPRISPFPLWTSADAREGCGYSQRFSTRACKHLHTSWMNPGPSVISKCLWVSN